MRWQPSGVLAALNSLWPKGLAGRTILVLLAAVVLVHLGTVALYHDDLPSRAGAAFADQVAGRLAVAAHAMMDVPAPERDIRAHALSSPGLELHWGDHAAVALHPGDASLPNVRRRMLELAPDLGEVALQVGSGGDTGEPGTLGGSVRLADGSFLNFESPIAGIAPWASHATLLSTALMAAGVVAVAAVMLRGLIRPLQRLASAAEAIGLGPAVDVPETGPKEVKHVARAFNGMQARIHQLVSDRTEALAAVSHDLRTPITRLRLRAGFVTDPEMQAAMDADLEEMEAMVEATLAYLRGEDAAEPRRMTDLSALLATLVDDAADAGADVAFDGPAHLPAALHASSMKRAFANLVNNALIHGGSARVALSACADGIRVIVDDNGPGIPDAELERVFEPFRRLDHTRSRATGGVGLGLAIARRAVGHEGGDIRLTNKPAGGLRAEVHLPQVTDELVSFRGSPYGS